MNDEETKQRIKCKLNLKVIKRSVTCSNEVSNDIDIGKLIYFLNLFFFLLQITISNRVGDVKGRRLTNTTLILIQFVES